jgi:hypothetical protein
MSKRNIEHLSKFDIVGYNKPIYLIRKEFNFDDLTDYEKKLAYESAEYKIYMNNMEAYKRQCDLMCVCDFLYIFKDKLPKQIKKIVEKYMN